MDSERPHCFKSVCKILEISDAILLVKKNHESPRCAASDRVRRDVIGPDPPSQARTRTSRRLGRAHF